MLMDGRKYRDRSEAGRILADAMKGRGYDRDLLILALPRGGVPVAYQVSRALCCAMDVLIVRKLGLPGHEELAMGAIACGGGRVLNSSVIDQYRITSEQIDQVAARESRELQRREQQYRGDQPPLDVLNRSVALVDDGLATGSTMQAAIDVIREQGARRIAVAVPVAPPDTVARLRRQVDDVVCPHTPDNFMAIGQWYERFEQTDDEQVRRLLAEAAVS